MLGCIGGRNRFFVLNTILIRISKMWNDMA